MITVILSGGLGNQMFQYALGRALQVRRKDRMQLDLTYLLDKRLHEVYRDYALDIFAVDPDLTMASHLFRAFPALLRAPGRRRIERVLRKRNLEHIDESGFRYDPGILNRNAANISLCGYWQSPKYFEDMPETIRRDFSFRAPLSAEGRRLATSIAECNSVGVHIRRGDYVSVASAIEGHGFMGIEYYRRAIGYLRERLPDLHLFVASDDLAWCRANLTEFGAPATLLDHTPPRNKIAEDLNLLSQCRHFVISNSSFGWWGAWLSRNPGKMVVCPARWCKNPALEPEDLVPESWIRM